MPDEKPIAHSKRLLEPIERISEVLFGLIMVLAITSAFRIAEPAGGAVKTMLLAALGCNLAWGIIDAVLYLMGCLAEAGRGLATLHAVRNTSEAAEAQRLIADSLPPAVASIVQPAEYTAMHERFKQLPEPPKIARLQKQDWLAAFYVCLWVFGSTFPVVIPFLFIRNPESALNVSNAVGIAMLFGVGYAFGRSAGRNPWVKAIIMVLVGSALVLLTKKLGG